MGPARNGVGQEALVSGAVSASRRWAGMRKLVHAGLRVTVSRLSLVGEPNLAGGWSLGWPLCLA